MAATFLLQFQQPATGDEPVADTNTTSGAREEQDQRKSPRCETGTFTKASMEAPDRDDQRLSIIPAA